MIFIFYIEPSYKMQTIQNLGFFLKKTKQTRKGFLDNRIMLNLKVVANINNLIDKQAYQTLLVFFFLANHSFNL